MASIDQPPLQHQRSVPEKPASPGPIRLSLPIPSLSSNLPPPKGWQVGEEPSTASTADILFALKIVGPHRMAEIWPTARPPIFDITGVAHKRLEALRLA